jgi:hypothetical protein
VQSVDFAAWVTHMRALQNNVRRSAVLARFLNRSSRGRAESGREQVDAGCRLGGGAPREEASCRWSASTEIREADRSHASNSL